VIEISSLAKLREEGSMTRRSLLIALVSATGAMAVTDVASKPEDKFALANEEVKELLLLLDTDKNGRISKQEWMNFMEAEFNKLDRDGNGELDPKELLQSKLSARRGSSAPTTKKLTD
jgi:Ca2+-binding EF-hand superfamily protein